MTRVEYALTLRVFTRILTLRQLRDYLRGRIGYSTVQYIACTCVRVRILSKGDMGMGARIPPRRGPLMFRPATLLDVPDNAIVRTTES
jgi:hypothetical protein